MACPDTYSPLLYSNMIISRINGDEDGFHKNQVHVIGFNTESDSRMWSDNDRLSYIRVEYRPLGTFRWYPALNMSNLPLYLPNKPNDGVRTTLLDERT